MERKNEYMTTDRLNPKISGKPEAMENTAPGDYKAEPHSGRHMLIELSAGSILWGIICQLAGVWFSADKAGYSLGLAIGTLLAVLAGTHMWWALDKALDFSQSAASKMIVRNSMIRYMVIVIALGAIMISGFANPLSAFLGLMGLKVSAYIQPFTHKAFTRFYKKKDI